MSDGTKIEWAEASWNPIRARNRKTGAVGWFCTHASPGCIVCYAEAMNARLGTGIAFQAQNADKVEIFVDEKTLLQPLKWKKPRRIFVCSMTDLFGEFVTDEMIKRVFGVMAACPQHDFLVLTKRPAPMRDFVSRGLDSWIDWPLPNVWLGTSIEDQRRAGERIRELRATPAAIRFLSIEPQIERIDLIAAHWNDGPGIDWVIVGGESGKGARPFDIAWAAEIVGQCELAGVPCFVKQVGARPVLEGAPLRRLASPKGGDPAEWPEAIRVRQFPEPRR